MGKQKERNYRLRISKRYTFAAVLDIIIEQQTKARQNDKKI
jgi:hypothetical protein